MASTLEKIKTLLSTKEESKETKMYAEMILDDGRVLATEDEQFMIGSEVYVVGDDGETSKLSAGSYTMSDGAKITVDDDSKIVDLGEEKEAEDVEEASKEEMADAEDTDWAKTFEEMKDRVAALEKEVFGDKAEEETEEMSKEEDGDEKVEMSKDLVNSLVEEVEHLKAKVVELEKTPGAEGFSHTPESNTKLERPNLAKMSASERAAYYINNKN
tara:strand:+ start:138 stop:782 length:645 start_codon:yes stop_codon:yes gene_type:complete